jgi:hypothetical protein
MIITDRYGSSILESGHFYSVKGPTQWSRIGWRILNTLKKNGDKTMLFIDDIHQMMDVHEQERHLPCIPFDPKPDFSVKESEVSWYAFQVLEILKNLPKRKKARLNGADARKWHCSGIPLTHANGNPTCILLDVGLTLMKQNIGFVKAVNILPLFYKEQQRGVLRLVEKAMPDFHLEVILFSLDGSYETIML